MLVSVYVMYDHDCMFCLTCGSLWAKAVDRNDASMDRVQLGPPGSSDF